MKHANIALFVPHIGCPHRCSFCDQNAISGAERPPEPADVTAACETALQSLGSRAAEAEIAFFGGSFTAIDRGYMLRLLDVQVISYDKVNQLRHVRYLKDKAHVLDLMKQHAEILKQRFDVVTSTLEKEIAPLGLATWNRPKGGYFVSVNTLPGLAKRTIELCRQAGVIMTNAGATFPYGIDPKDQNIRIAPSYPSVSELQQAMDVFCCCLKCAAFEQMSQNS